MINTLWNDYLDKVSYINHLTDLPFFMYVVRKFKQMFSCCCSCCSVTQLCPPLRCLAFLSFTISRSLLKLMSIESVMPSNYLILCCPLLLLPSIFPSLRVFSNESVFTSGGQSIGVSASASVLPMNIQDWAPLGLTGWISLQSKGLSKVFSNSTVQKHQIFGAQLFI